MKKGNFLTWPGLVATNADKYCEENILVAKSHLNQERKSCTAQN